jgi:NTE family protein
MSVSSGVNDGRPRVGLVLGAGGVAGLAFHAGVLAALEAVTGWDPRRATIMVGTSAGSITATALRAGLSAGDLFARSEGRPPSEDGRQLLSPVGEAVSPAMRSSGRVRPPAELAARLARAATRPLAARPMALLAGLVPAGAGDTELIATGIRGLLPGSSPRDALWVCAVRERDGRLVVFGRDDQLPLPEAVAASCAIPGFFRPVTIGGEVFVDGAVHSPTNADVLTGCDLDLVVVSAPMSLAGWGVRLAVDQPVRSWSRLLLDAEVRQLRRRGTPVVVFHPTSEDAGVIGVNAMDEARRPAVARQVWQSTLRQLSREDARDRLSAIMS